MKKNDRPNQRVMDKLAMWPGRSVAFATTATPATSFVIQGKNSRSENFILR